VEDDDDEEEESGNYSAVTAANLEVLTRILGEV